MSFRIGHGYDVHQLALNESLILGGINIDFPKGIKGHSDGDVLVHAIIDSLLGAMNVGDLGTLFPPSKTNRNNLFSNVFTDGPPAHFKKQ